MKRISVVIVVVIIIILALVVYKLWPRGVNNSVVPETSYEQQLQQIPSDSRYAIGNIVYQGAGVFDRTIMKLDILPDNPKGAIEFSNNSSEQLNLVLEAAPKDAKIAKTVNIGPQKTLKVMFTSQGTYIFHEKDYPNSKVTVELNPPPGYQQKQ